MRLANLDDSVYDQLERTSHGLQPLVEHLLRMRLAGPPMGAIREDR
jgi:hypothetical protein